VQGFGKAVAVKRQYVERYHKRARYDHAYICAELLALERLRALAYQYEIIYVEVDAEKHHEHRYHRLQIVAWVRGNACVLYAEAARARGGKGVYNAVKKRHSARKQQHEQQHSHGDIYKIQHPCGVLHFGRKLAHNGPRAFRAQKMHAFPVALCKRHDRHHEYQHAHAAYPVREGAPVKQAVGQQLNIGKYGCAGGGEAGYGFKNAVHKARYIPAEIKRQAAE